MNAPRAASPDPELFRRASAELDEILDLEPEEREPRILRLEASDAALAAEVRSLLVADGEAGEFLAHPLDEALPTWIAALAEEPSDLAPGARIGAWRVVRPLGRGGMGEVYEVERADGAFEGRAALKLIRRGLDSEAIVARFRAERQILARLRHPAIAHLYDGGATEDGRPYLVMELVTGRPIADACRGLDLRARIERFLVVCDAVEAAHRALVVHRDLKPANVLVTEKGEVKLLDFGIAKLLDPEVSGEATQVELRALTPAYAAPEQILGEPVTTATDVYALGAVLFELLAGRPAHSRTSTSAMELARELDREQLEKPSRVAARAESDAAAIPAKRLRGDLDAIVLRALAREPDRRYRSAEALGDDLRRFLSGRPVAARPDSIAYRAGRFARRNRVVVGSVALILLALVVGLGAALLQARRARAEAARADAAAAQARRESERATRIKEFVLSVFREADPQQRARDVPLSLDSLVAAAEARIETELADDPVVQAELWDDLSETRTASGDNAGGLRLVEKSLATKRAHLAPGDPSIAESLANRANIRVRLDDPEGALADADEATAILAAAGRIESREGAVLATIRVVALQKLERYEEGLAAALRAHELHRRYTGEDHPWTVMQLSNVAFLELALGRPERARDRYLDVIAAVERTNGPDHSLLYYPYNGLSKAEREQGRLDAAEAAARRALAIGAAQLGPRSWMVGESLQQLGQIALARGDRGEAVRRFEEGLAILRESAPTRKSIPEIEKALAELVD